MAKRIDSLQEGQEVTLRLHGSARLGNEPDDFTTIFESIVGTGNERQAHFNDIVLYRYQGYWAYGTSAERASLIKVA